jgi:hypothetical protein
MERLWPTDRGDWGILLVFSGFPLGLGPLLISISGKYYFPNRPVSIRHLPIDELEAIKDATVIKTPKTKNNRHGVGPMTVEGI